MQIIFGFVLPNSIWHPFLLASFCQISGGTLSSFGFVPPNASAAFFRWLRFAEALSGEDLRIAHGTVFRSGSVLGAPGLDRHELFDGPLLPRPSPVFVAIETDEIGSGRFEGVVFICYPKTARRSSCKPQDKIGERHSTRWCSLGGATAECAVSVALFQYLSLKGWKT
jgi:hypothetical protein